MPSYMLHNFFKVTLRTLWRNKDFSAINILGLAIGMAAAMLIGLWVQQEISFDRFHAKKDRLYLVYSRELGNGNLDVWPRASTMLSAELKKNYPEVEDAIRYRNVFFLVTEGEKHFNLEGAFTDSGFLSMFSFPLLQGDPKTALNSGQGIVLTAKLAKSLFGNEDAMGKMVRIESKDVFKVTGVLKDLPTNTEFNFQYLLPWAYVDRLKWDIPNWGTTNAQAYVLLKSGASHDAFDAKIKDIVKTHVTDANGAGRETFTQPISRMHLYSKAENGQLVTGQITTVRLFIIIGIFILLIACVNFMNLSTARSEKRSREVGIRKVVGARKSALITQFIGESILLTAFGFVLALAIVQLSLGSFNQVINSSLAIDYADPLFWLAALAFVLFTGIVAGSYPAFFLSSSKPSSVLKGAVSSINTLLTPRKVLVVFQFTFAIVLITGTLIVRQQLSYVHSRDAGYDRDRLVFAFSQGGNYTHYDLIRHDLLASGAAIAVTRTFSPITRLWGTVTGFSWPGSTPTDTKTYFQQFAADAGFVRTTGTRLVQGRDIDIRTYPTDSTALLLNESAVKAMRLTDPIGKIVTDEGGGRYHIVGVIKDFIIESPYDPIQPMLIQGLQTDYPVIHYRLNPANSIADDLAKAEKIFKQYNPQYPFEYNFVDEAYNDKFRTEQQEGTLGTLFAALAIFISCLGLFGLAIHMAENRRKEIGIRKVLGASVAGIAVLLSGDFVKLVLVAVVIATPIAWYAMNNWLQGFNYRIALTGWIFLVSGTLAVVIALLTVGYQAVRAAIANPVRSLRSE
ncbi:ABC transporter permease [Puia dinghuensis]|uniref:ABC transporter permease n=1 Tax=Puia dinghuensis TaxID=1792502 RepID=A0A8J2XTW7_9BACT|nr:ABC transporter permease [Puia dinghuensis]GGB02861.1 ABC transporter permease [Puia dinghuensis]